VRRRAAALVLAAAALAAAQAQATAARCIGPDDARTLVLIALPDAIDGLAARCATALPPNAFLRSRGAALADRYRHEAPVDPARARRALEAVTGQDLSFLASDTTVSTLAHEFVGNAIRERVSQNDCPAADALVALAAPMRADAMAEALLLALQIAGPGAALPGGLHICRDDEEPAR
jgi:hypothetical protein